MQLTYVPEVCSGDEREYEGKVTLRMPSFEDRLDLQEEIGFEADQAKPKWTQQLRAMVKRLPDYLVSIDVKRLSDGYEFKTLDEAKYESGLGAMITEACLKLVGKYQVGNASISS